MRLNKLSSTGNFTRLDIFSNLSIYFSYETPIAIVKNGEAYISKNNWGVTTGKHINNVKREYPEYTVLEHSDLLFRINLNI